MWVCYFVCFLLGCFVECWLFSIDGLRRRVVWGVGFVFVNLILFGVLFDCCR